MQIVDKNDSIFTCLSSLHISSWNLQTVMYSSAETRPGRVKQLRLIGLWEVKLFKSMLLSQKHCHGCLKGSDYSSILF